MSALGSPPPSLRIAARVRPVQIKLECTAKYGGRSKDTERGQDV
ncbi:predicted protein [Histoplasma mississippiense (nom. inval.)]|nr:predicted protein [Histoplasma mississippiense (nom. inval.)]EDN05873.1 predicted protein [Histoplasma mississippiense (nom. inval.)]